MKRFHLKCPQEQDTESLAPEKSHSDTKKPQESQVSHFKEIQDGNIIYPSTL